MYDVGDILGKKLYAATNVATTRNYLPNSEPYKLFTEGDLIGEVYSYIHKNGQIWWMFLDKKGRPYYAKHHKGMFNQDALREQGVLTIREKELLNDDTPEWVKQGKGLIKFAIVGFGGIAIIKALINR